MNTKKLILYKLYIFIAANLLFISTYPQVPTNGDYRTRKNAGGSSCTDCWQVRSGGTWVNTTNAFPPANANVYVQNGHTFFNSSTTIKDLHIHTGGKFNNDLGTLTLTGKLRAYTGTLSTTTGADGTFYSSQVSSANPPDYIMVGQVSTLNITGASRNITITGEWGYTRMGGVYVDINMNAGNTATFQTDFSAGNVEIYTGTVDMGTNTLYAEEGNAGFPSLEINAGTTFISSNSGSTGGNCVLALTPTTATDNLFNYGTIILKGASPYIHALSVYQAAGSIIEYAGTVNQNFVNASFAGAVPINTYRNLRLSGSGTKTPLANFAVKENITISGSSILVMGALAATVTGNWTSYSQAGLSEGTSTVTFDSTGAQSINTTGGENFYIMRKSNSGTLTLNSNVNIVAGGNLTMQSGVIDANANTFSGTATSAFNMSGGTIRLAKPSTTLPEFLVTPYNLTGGTIELDGAGTQTLRGARDYRNLTFSNSGTKGISTAINNITGTVTVANSVILDVLNNTMGGTGTNLTMTGTSLYRTAGSSDVKPDADGNYSLGSGTTIEFNNNLTGLESIRFVGAATVNYAKIIVSGTSVGTASLNTGIRFQSGGSFTVKNAAIFKQINSTGFSGLTTTAISSTNNPTIILEPGSTVEYNGADQMISAQAINTPAAAHYEGLTLSGAGNKTAPAGNLIINGNFLKTGSPVFMHNNGTVIMNGSLPQSYTSSYPGMVFNNLTNNNTVDLSVYSELSLVSQLSFANNSKLNLQTGSNIILLSTLNKTANIGIIPLTATINYIGAGKFTINRFIPTGTGPAPNHGKSWQFLAVPTNGGQTVNHAWQDSATAANQNRYPGFGTQLTSNISPLPSLFDVFTSPGPSIKVFDTATDNWKGILNTTSVTAYNQKGYMVFVRGDRSVITSAAIAVPTILRSSGRIFHPVSNIPPVTNIGNTKYESIGNPYASAIDFSNDAAVLKSANVQRVYYVWDPKLGGGYGFGAFQTFTRGAGADNNYYVSPGGGSYGPSGSVNNFIQSGQAFFVHTFGGTGIVSFTENAKVNNSSLTFRPATQSSMQIPQLRNNLYVVSDGNPVLIDGVLNQFDRSFSNSIDRYDAIKIGNTGESISIVNGITDLSVERRKIITPRDTLNYKIEGLRLQQYEFEFIPFNINAAGLEAYLEDDFLNTVTPVRLDATTRIRFEVINNPGSFASGRFRVVFVQKKNCDEKIPLYSYQVPADKY